MTIGSHPHAFGGGDISESLFSSLRSRLQSDEGRASGRRLCFLVSGDDCEHEEVLTNVAAAVAAKTFTVE